MFREHLQVPHLKQFLPVFIYFSKLKIIAACDSGFLWEKSQNGTKAGWPKDKPL